MAQSGFNGLEIAIIGYSGKFNNCKDVEEYWDKLFSGEETFHNFSNNELDECGIAEDIYNNSSYIKVKGVLRDKECFDPHFFGYTPAEANIMDPQIRIFHEIVWNGLEMAGCSPEKTNKKIGLYASASDNNLWQSIMSLNGSADSSGLETSYLSNKDHLCSLISYKLNLKGPAIFTQTACSSSLVAVHQAVRSLLTGDCEIAVAGGISTSLLDKGGYEYHEHLIYSPDGHCRAFDSKAAGTLKGEGGAVVVMKKYKDALKDGDTIHAVIKGTAVNNDGSDKIGFTAPGIQGQKRVIKSAVQLAGIDPNSVSYIETHGTATKLGDPVEFKALNDGYGQTGNHRNPIGSVKTNIGHLDSAAGIASLVKVILMMKYKKIPASLHFSSPNPEIDFENASFYVNHELQDWKSPYAQLRAGISSFGIGGTNCHIIVEEAVQLPEVANNEPTSCTINLSSKSSKKLHEAGLFLADHLKKHPGIKLSDLSYTLNLGRTDFNYRTSVTASDTEDLIQKFQNNFLVNSVLDGGAGRHHCVFMFSGQGAQYIGMAKDLYEKYSFFRQQMDECFDLIKQHHGILLKEVIYQNEDNKEIKINDTLFTQLSLFTVSYAMAKFLMAIGIHPDALIGHSIGEYVGAVISDMITLDEAVQVVGKRASLMQSVARGEMYAVFIEENELKEILNPDLSIAAVNDDGIMVISGNKVAMDAFVETLNSKNITSKKLNTSHAFHSAMMDEILEAYEEFLGGYSFKKGKIPLISNVSGKFLDENRDAIYWRRHLRDTVRFGEGLKTLIAAGYTRFIEVGPGNQLAKLVERLAAGTIMAVNTLRPAHQDIKDVELFGQNIGKLWANGSPVEWAKLYEGQQVRKIPLPLYQFERLRFPLKVDLQKLISNLNSSYLKPAESSKNWLYELSWTKDRLAIPASVQRQEQKNLIVFCDKDGMAESSLEKSGIHLNALIKIRTGEKYQKNSPVSYVINYHNLKDYGKLIEDLKLDGYEDADIIHAFGLNDFSVSLDDSILQGYLSIVFLVKSLSDHLLENDRNIIVLATEMAKINADDQINPAKAMLLGALKIISVEHDHLNCKLIDPGRGEISIDKAVFEERLIKDDQIIIAYRNHSRFIPSIEAVEVKEADQVSLKHQGCYLVTGGLGGMGLSIAQDLALKEKASVALVSRRDFPAESERKAWVDSHEKEDATSQIIQQIWNMEKNGAEVLVLKADVADELQMRNAIRLTEEKFGKINGLIWAAGVIDYDGIIRNRNQDQFINNIKLKVHGILIAEQLLNFGELDFIALFSSAGNLYYKEKFGQVAYNVANEFTDAFARSNADKYRIFTINWCDWKNVGMTVDGLKKRDAGLSQKDINAFLKDGLTSEEGIQVFRHCLKKTGSAYTISKKNLKDFFAQENEGHTENNEVIEMIENSFERPELLTPFMAPTTKTEIFLSNLCCSLFGLNKVGVNDDFLELGGDSLKAVKYINQVKNELNIKISLGDFFNHPTILQLSKIIDLKLSPGERPESDQQQIDLSGNYPLLPAQNRIFILDRLNPLQTIHNQVFTFKTKPLSKEKLNGAIRTLVEKHDVLRSSFDLEGEQPIQHFRKQVATEIESYSIQQDNELEAVLKQFERPFNLSVPPLFRIGYVNNNSGYDFLLVDIHHIISDGVSNKVFLTDLFCELDGLQSTEKSSNFSAYIQEFYTAEMQEEIKAEGQYWLNKFKNYSQLNGLMLDHPRKANDQKIGKRHRFRIPADLSQLVINEAKNEGVTLFTYTLSALYVLLKKLTGEPEVIVGTTHFGRDITGFENTMGMFIETIPLRNAVDNEMAFQVFLNQVKNNTYEDFDNRKFPFEELIAKLELPKDRKRNPLFDIVFSSDNIGEAITVQSYQDTELSYIEHRNIKVGFDLLFTFNLQQNELSFCFEYNSGLFEEKTILLYSAYYEQILNQIIEKPDLKIKDISLLSAKVDAVFPATVLRGEHVTQTTESHIFTKFSQIAQTNSDTTAIYYGEKQMTYGQLASAVNKLSDYLCNNYNIKEGDNVAVYLTRSEFLIIAVLAIIKSRAVFVPIDISLPEERVKYMMETSAAKAVLTLSDYMFDLTYFEGIVFCMDIQLADLPANEENAFNGELTDVAYILFTSGSTGYPKGVKLSHRGLANYIGWANEFYFHGQQTYDLPLYTSVSFDFTLTSIFSPLLRGAAVYVYEDERSVDECLKNIFQSEIKAIKATPAHIDMLNALNIQHTSMEVVILGGEALLPKQVSFLKKLNKNIRVFNEYGPTEATVACTATLIDDENEFIAVGSPVRNTQIYILDEQHNVLPSNVPGEIFIAGECLAEGYLNEENTRDSFITLPADHQVKIYKSGDRGFLNSDNKLVYMGRILKNDQVKIRGYRIELKEIEKIFSDIEKVDRAVALVKKLNNEDTLVAYYLADEQLDERKIKAVLTRFLPKPMIPGIIIWLKEFPVNINGKIDYNLFPDPVITKSDAYIPPVYEAEIRLVEIWSDVLNIEKESIGLNDGFFAMGGNSLKVVLLGQKIEEAFGITVQVAELFDHDTISIFINKYLKDFNKNNAAINALDNAAS
ncbi:amino acid adenylation domain-containing protein [Pedobacter suwonensis]|uniref:Amino acid adenylation domain-containing protein n=1 Tax=Pedobacter suwonensis TaxID=332999 RepID=A0A1I0U8P7_9SPHI|nr:hybrid non-ribosomal peptide synthetase/type I polyketide synthase [Pedobacter suwonensis]SFA60233.1 amino acid adenylation domain-containing protein [Pedobacter suwonensis]